MHLSFTCLFHWCFGSERQWLNFKKSEHHNWWIALLDVSAPNTPLFPGTDQMLGNAGSTGFLKENVIAGSGTISSQYTNGTPSLKMADITLMLSTNTIFTIPNAVGTLLVGIYPLIGIVDGGWVADSVTNGAVPVMGEGTAAQAVLAIADGELILVVRNTLNSKPPNLSATISGNSLNLSWPPDPWAGPWRPTGWV